MDLLKSEMAKPKQSEIKKAALKILVEPTMVQRNFLLVNHDISFGLVIVSLTN